MFKKEYMRFEMKRGDLVNHYMSSLHTLIKFLAIRCDVISLITLHPEVRSI
jgi:hypothetical protein